MKSIIKLIKAVIAATGILFLLLVIYDQLYPSDFCRSYYLSPLEIDERNLRAKNGNIIAIYNLRDHYIACDDETNISKLLAFYRKFQFSDNNMGLVWSKSLELGIQQWKLGDTTEDIVENLELLATDNVDATTMLIRPYQYDDDMFSKTVAKSLYYAKLLGCQENEPYSYAPYLYALFYDQPDNKECIKVAYAMLAFTRLNAYEFYKYSDFWVLERNMTAKLGMEDSSYVLSNYQQIIADECAGILSDHDQVPTEEKLMRYAFPLKSDANASNLSVLIRK
jgi:hypothetical protein